jgi:hypothetical protein
MRRLILTILLAAPLAGLGQAAITISPGQCVWRAGDDVRWAAPDLDETGWTPDAQWSPTLAQQRMWVRCHQDLTSLDKLAHPAIQVSLDAAYELYVDGGLVGRAGSLESGNFSVDTIRAFPLDRTALKPGPSTVALRVDRRLVRNANLVLSLPAPRLEIRAGDPSVLDALRARTILDRCSRVAAVTVFFSIIGVIAVMLLGLFFYDRSRHELLLLSLSCLCTSAIRLNEFAAAALVDYPFFLNRAIFATCNFIQPFVYLLAFFGLNRRRVPRIFWVLATASAMIRLWAVALALLDVSKAPWLAPRHFDSVILMGGPINLALSLAPFVAFWPYAQIPARMRPVAALCMLWGVADGIWFMAQVTQRPMLGLPNFFGRWSGVMLDARGFITMCVLAALLGLLFREQRLVAVERAQFAGEMASAREIQQYLIPEHLPETPGLAVESAYHPSREVGGDFFQVLPDARDGGTLIVVGDVAGKGLRAGMLAALIVGAIRTAFKFTNKPGEILALLNERLQGRGLVTCMALRIDRDGSAELANAGHLPPYINGKEMAVEGTLPLGALPGIAFRTMRFELAAGEAMLLVSDGVVEARNAAGELFGFERTREISGQSAERIAEAAQQFGQEDDITVLTLSLVPVAVART